MRSVSGAMVGLVVGLAVTTGLIGESRADEPPAPAPAPAAAPEKEKPWYEKFEMQAFSDTYVSVNANNPKPQTNANRYHSYNANTGFSVAWAGFDLSMAPEPVGFTIMPRFGPAVPTLAVNDLQVPGGIGFVQQVYAVWKPGGKDGKLTLIAGKFDAIFGAEVAKSQDNFNYSRGTLYKSQPFFHTGIRADVVVSDLVGLKFMAVNGWNNSVDNNSGKSFGGRVDIAPTDKLSILLGYLGGPEQADYVPATATTPESKVDGANGRWRHLIDLVVDFKVSEKLHLAVNGDFVTEKISADKWVSWFGASVLARYQATDVFAVAGRFEFIGDKDDQVLEVGTTVLGDRKPSLITATATLEAMPTRYLVLRLDTRLDRANVEAFSGRVGESAVKNQITTTLGIVAKTN